MKTIKIEVSTELAQQLRPYTQQLPQILAIGLRYLEQQQQEQDRVSQALLSTGFIQHLKIDSTDSADAARQPPPILSGSAVSEILIAQRRGEL